MWIYLLGLVSVIRKQATLFGCAAKKRPFLKPHSQASIISSSKQSGKQTRQVRADRNFWRNTEMVEWSFQGRKAAGNRSDEEPACKRLYAGYFTREPPLPKPTPEKHTDKGSCSTVPVPVYSSAASQSAPNVVDATRSFRVWVFILGRWVSGWR